MTSTVTYKFKNEPYGRSVTFTGQRISLFELKQLIYAQQNVGNDGESDGDLRIINEANNEGFLCDIFLFIYIYVIFNNAYLIKPKQTKHSVYNLM